MLLVKLFRDLTHNRFTPNGGLVREMGPLISGKSRLVKYYSIWPDAFFLRPGHESSEHGQPDRLRQGEGVVFVNGVG